jgi:hypothetical protein
MSSNICGFIKSSSFRSSNFIKSCAFIKSCFAVVLLEIGLAFRKEQNDQPVLFPINAHLPAAQVSVAGQIPSLLSLPCVRPTLMFEYCPCYYCLSSCWVERRLQSGAR